MNGVTLYDGRKATPQQRVAQLKNFKESDAYEYLQAENKRALEAMEARIFNPKTSNEERQILVCAREELIKRFSPEALVKDGIRYSEIEIKRLESEAERRSD